MIREWAISKNLAWIVRVDGQKLVEVLLNPKRMIILAINRDMALLHHFATGGVPSIHNLVSELNFFLSLSERLDNFLLQLHHPGLVGLPDDLGELLLYSHSPPK